MKHIGLFEGIGGFSLAARWMGWETIAWCEWNEFGQKVLKHHFPKATPHGDITKTDFTIYKGQCDILTGGFPCQDASIAKSHGGARQGLDGIRTGLFYEMVRAIEEIKPRYIVAENVANITKTNNGRDFAKILNELGRLGYNAEWRICRASEVGASHNRARLYLVAYSNCIGQIAGESFFSFVVEEIPQARRNIARTTTSVGVSWINEPPITFVDDGLPSRLDGITFPKFRSESIMAGGNAIVPQVAYQIFKAIELCNCAHIK
jgi:DNA (cytosine-5)-methyltransferase 1